MPTKEEQIQKLAYDTLVALEQQNPEAASVRFKDIVETAEAHRAALGIEKTSLYTQLNTAINNDNRIRKVSTGRYTTRANTANKPTASEQRAESKQSKPARSTTELDRLKKENEELRQLISELTLRLHKLGGF